MDAELVNLYHLAKTALSGQDDSKWARMCWAAREYHKKYPEILSLHAYLRLEEKLNG